MYEAASFGQWLKQQRKHFDLTQEELAERVGCSYITIRKIESAERRPSRQVAYLLADLFNVPPGELDAFIAFARGSDNPTPSPPAVSGHHPTGNLPSPLTPLIGREEIVVMLCDMLAREPQDGEVRLLTLTGPPGIGKTRLSLQIAANLLGSFPDGVWFVELAALVEAKLVVSTIGSALGLKESGGIPILETLKEHFRNKHLLLVVDNFEHVTDAAMDVSQLLASGKGVKMLVTSRTPLRVRGEREYSVPPLTVPDPKRLPVPEKLKQYEAVRLFIERAQAVNSDFEVNDDNAPAVAGICVDLDGLPLAIELAAARVKMLPPNALLTQLSQRFKLLTGGARDLSARQRTLRGAIDWSYDLLDEGARQLFTRMAVFRAGRTLEALDSVCNYDGHLQVDLLDGVQSLLDRSLLQQRQGSDGEPRFWMLQTIQEYAKEKLEGSGEAEALARAHALYFMKLAEEAEPRLRGAEAGRWLNTLDDEHDNFRTALRWASAPDELANSGKMIVSRGEGEPTERVEIGLRISGAICRFWDIRGHFGEGREWLGELLGLLGSEEQAGLERSPAGRTMPEQIGLQTAREKSLEGSALLAIRQADYSTARSLLEESLVVGKALGDKLGIANSLRAMGTMAHVQGDYSTARSLHGESLALMRELGDLWGIANSLNNLAILTHEQGDYSTARSLHEESLALMRELGDLLGIANSLNNLGNVAVDEGDYTFARSRLEESLAIRRALGDKRGIAIALHNLGDLALRQRDYRTSRSLLEESLILRIELKDKWGMAYSLAGLGRVVVAASVADGGVERGAKVLGAVEAIVQSMGAVLERGYRLSYEEAVAFARSHLGEEAFERVWQAGRAMSLEQVIDYALEQGRIL
jgi:predicted ATPase/transcriptional regulator with XRE-family HTH domain